MPLRESLLSGRRSVRILERPAAARPRRLRTATRIDTATPALAIGEPSPGALHRLELVTHAPLARSPLAAMRHDLLGRLSQALDADPAAIMLINERRNELVVRAS